jgi:hypothetical protein
MAVSLLLMLPGMRLSYKGCKTPNSDAQIAVIASGGASRHPAGITILHKLVRGVSSPRRVSQLAPHASLEG